MKRYLFLVLWLVASVAYAEEFPFVPGMEGQPSMNGTPREAPAPPVIDQPVWKILEDMSAEDRANSEIMIDLGDKADNDAIQMSDRIEDLWNTGRYEQALTLFTELSGLTDPKCISLANSWRTPVPTNESTLWGWDTRIGNRDSVVVNVLDIHRSSGNLFAVLLFQGDGLPARWGVYLSTNGGTSWSETFWIGNMLFAYTSVSAAVILNHLYVAWPDDPARSRVALYRFLTSNGARENFNNGQQQIIVMNAPSPDSIKEVSITSNQDFLNNRLYCLAITTSGNLKYSWSDTAGVNWNAVTTNVTDASRGLDATCNEGFDSLYIWSSYISTSNYVKIDTKSSAGPWRNLSTMPVGAIAAYTAIGAYGDTVTCYFDYQGFVEHIQYLVTYNGGFNWFYGTVGDTTVISESPDVAARDGGGVGVVFRFYTFPRQERYSWRHYSGGWSSPLQINDYQPYFNKPSIEYLGGGVYGTVYLCWTSPVERGAYFDRSDATGLVETPSLPERHVLLQTYPNPFNATAAVKYILPAQGDVRIEIYDLLGRRVAALANETQEAGYHQLIWNASSVPSGVYFCRLITPDDNATTRMVLLK